MTELDNAAVLPADRAHGTPKPIWLTVQSLAFSDAGNAQQELDDLVQQTAHQAVRLPLLRAARAAESDYSIDLPNGTTVDIKKGRTTTFILDTVSR
jgi:hypothetical protein